MREQVKPDGRTMRRTSPPRRILRDSNLCLVFPKGYYTAVALQNYIAGGVAVADGEKVGLGLKPSRTSCEPGRPDLRKPFCDV